MKKSIRTFLGLLLAPLLVVGGLSLSAAPAYAANPTQTANAIQRIFDETNQLRLAGGLPPLVKNSGLEAVAMSWSQQQYNNYDMTHNPNYASQIPTGYSLAGENVAYGYTPEQVVQGWKASPGHYANIMGNFTDIGIGYYEQGGERYYTQNFANYPSTKTYPGPSSNPILTSTSKSVDISIPLPRMTGNLPVDNYEIKFVNLTTGVETTHNTSLNNYTISGLSELTDYSVTVRATNSMGTGAWSATINVRTKETPPIVDLCDNLEGVQETIPGGYVRDGVNGCILFPIEEPEPNQLTNQPTPIITGKTTYGQTLNLNVGKWDDGVSVSYQWYRNGLKITNATDTTYVIGVSDVPARITAKVTAEKTGYATAVKTSPELITVPFVFTATYSPVIVGKVAVGETLNTTIKTWAVPAESYNYQWYRNNVAISGANASSYTVTQEDAGKELLVKAKGNRPGYTSVLRTSNLFVVPLLTISTYSKPAISGKALPNEILTATYTPWADGTTYGLQWYKNGVAISGATKSTYTLKLSDAKAKITVKLTGKLSGYQSLGVTSNYKTISTLNFTSAKVPTITGTVKVGKTLKANIRSWNPAATTYKYQWYASGKAISKATKSTYKISSKYYKKTITVKITGSKTGYDTFSQKSPSTKKVSR